MLMLMPMLTLTTMMMMLMNKTYTLIFPSNGFENQSQAYTNWWYSFKVAHSFQNILRNKCTYNIIIASIEGICDIYSTRVLFHKYFVAMMYWCMCIFIFDFEGKSIFKDNNEHLCTFNPVNKVLIRLFIKPAQ